MSRLRERLRERLGEGGGVVTSALRLDPLVVLARPGPRPRLAQAPAPPSPNLSHDAPHLGEAQSYVRVLFLNSVGDVILRVPTLSTLSVGR
jgi:hypothetical protein